MPKNTHTSNSNWGDWGIQPLATGRCYALVLKQDCNCSKPRQTVSPVLKERESTSLPWLCVVRVVMACRWHRLLFLSHSGTNEGTVCCTSAATFLKGELYYLQYCAKVLDHHSICSNWIVWAFVLYITVESTSFLLGPGDYGVNFNCCIKIYR